LLAKGGCSTLAGCHWLRPIGRISYGAYIYHSPVLCLFAAFTPGDFFKFERLWLASITESGLTYRLTDHLVEPLVKFSLCYPVTLLIAYLSFRYFEEPILRLRTRFS
jgi:peptidoglycan/LPS O-acetylase OafA/YrhL